MLSALNGAPGNQPDFGVCQLPLSHSLIPPVALIRGILRDDIHDLGAGEAFGSQRIEDADELRWSVGARSKTIRFPTICALAF